jgi:hypothetical protein
MYKNTRMIPHLGPGPGRKLRLSVQVQTYTYYFTYLHKEEGLEKRLQKQPHAHTPRQDSSLSDQTLGSYFYMIQFVPRLRLSCHVAAPHGPRCQILSYKTFRPRMNCYNNFPKCASRDQVNPSHSWIPVIAGERQEITRMQQSFSMGLASERRLFLLERATRPYNRGGSPEDIQLVGRETEALLRSNPIER